MTWQTTSVTGYVHAADPDTRRVTIRIVDPSNLRGYHDLHIDGLCYQAVAEIAVNQRGEPVTVVMT